MNNALDIVVYVPSTLDVVESGEPDTIGVQLTFDFGTHQAVAKSKTNFGIRQTINFGHAHEQRKTRLSIVNGAITPVYVQLMGKMHELAPVI